MKSPTSQNTLSVVIPSFNSSPFLADAIESILAAGLSEPEILVVDDGSTDDSLSIARSFPQVRCLTQENLGAASARNHGILRAKGNFLAFLDADDVWSPGGISHLVDILTSDPELDLALGRMQWVGKSLWKEDGQPDLLAPPLATFGFGACVMRRRAYDKTGKINEQLRRGEDTDWFLRARENGVRSYLTEEVVLYYRRHEGNITQNTKPIASLTLQLVKASLDRRREQGQVRSLEDVQIDPALVKKF